MWHVATKRMKATVLAVTYFGDAKVLAEVSNGLGEMGKPAGRGW